MFPEYRPNRRKQISLWIFCSSFLKNAALISKKKPPIFTIGLTEYYNEVSEPPECCQGIVGIAERSCFLVIVLLLFYWSILGRRSRAYRGADRQGRMEIRHNGRGRYRQTAIGRLRVRSRRRAGRSTWKHFLLRLQSAIHSSAWGTMHLEPMDDVATPEAQVSPFTSNFNGTFFRPFINNQINISSSALRWKLKI